MSLTLRLVKSFASSATMDFWTVGENDRRRSASVRGGATITRRSVCSSLRRRSRAPATVRANLCFSMSCQSVCSIALRFGWVRDSARPGLSDPCSWVGGFSSSNACWTFRRGFRPSPSLSRRRALRPSPTKTTARCGNLMYGSLFVMAPRKGSAFNHSSPTSMLFGYDRCLAAAPATGCGSVRSQLAFYSERRLLSNRNHTRPSASSIHGSIRLAVATSRFSSHSSCVCRRRSIS